MNGVSQTRLGSDSSQEFQRLGGHIDVFKFISKVAPETLNAFCGAHPYGRSALQIAAAYGQAIFVKEILEMGCCDADEVDYQGNTAAQLAQRHQDEHPAEPHPFFFV